jgi:hypothetical protein
MRAKEKNPNYGNYIPLIIFLLQIIYTYIYVTVQDGAKVTWYLMFNMLSLVSSDFYITLHVSYKMWGLHIEEDLCVIT